MPTTIAEIETILVDLPTIRAHRLAMTSMQQQTLVILRLRCSDGIEGLGEATTIGGLAYGEESPEAIKLNLDQYIAPLVVGMDPCAVHQVMHKVAKAVVGNPLAKSALETALLDAQGKRLGVPVVDLLGGAVRRSLPVLWTLASGDTAKDIEEAESLLSEGRHRRFKLKVGRRPWVQDVEHVVAIKRALGGRAAVTVDANQAWSEPDAVAAMARLEAAGVELVEQPVARHNHAALARLTQRFDISVMADEALRTPADAFSLASLGAADIFALKIAKSGGLWGVLRTAAVADAAGVGLYGGTMLEGTIGTVASAHAFCALSRLEHGTELFGPLLLRQDIVATPLAYGDNQLQLPTGPGLGVALDEQQLARFRRDR